MTPIFYFIRRMRSPRGFALFLLALSLSFASATIALAQDQAGVVTGTIADTHGTPISGATVQAMDVERHVKYTGTTDAKGVYHILHLPIGRYQISASASGYNELKKPAFRLSMHQTARVNVSLFSGYLYRVEVKDVAPLLQTDSAELRTTIDADAIENLP
jgi:hypothetical protein